MTGQTSTSSMPSIKVPAAWTLGGLTAGLLLGLPLSGSALEAPVLALADPVGALWLKALKMTIVPLVAGLLFTGIVDAVAAARAGRMARRTLGLFAAVLLAGGAMAAVVMPILLKLWPVPEDAFAALSGEGAGGAPVPGFREILDSLVPENVVSAAAGDAMLPLIVFIALFALASTRLADGQRRMLAGFFAALGAAMMVVIGWILKLAPVGVFALSLGLATGSGSAAIGVLAHYIVAVSAVGAVILLAAYALGMIVGRQGPSMYIRALLPAQTVALTTQSSLASLPAMLDSCRRLGLRERSGEFVLPLAVAMFRATSPAMNVAVAIYAAKLVGVELTPAAIATGVAVAFLVSLSTVSLPGTISFIASVGPVALAMGVPLAPLGILVAVEMLPDVMRTVANVTMNVAVTSVVDGEPSEPDQK